MWINSQTEDSLTEDTFRTFIFSTLGVGFMFYLVANFSEWWRIVPQISIVLFPVIVGTDLALRLTEKRLLAAQVAWLTSVAAAVTLAIYLFRAPEIALVYTVLPLLATVTLNWGFGLLTEVSVIALVYLVSLSEVIPPLATQTGLVIISSSIVSGAIGWIVVYTLFDEAQRARAESGEMRRQLANAFDQRLALKQTQEDLILANQELARLSTRLEVMYQVAEEARQAKEEFVANVSHELRTPLNMIIGFSDMITQSPEVYGAALPPALLTDILAIQRNSQHLAKLVDDVLDLSQVKAGRMALSKSWASLPQVANEAAQSVQALFAAKGLYLDVQVADDLPPIYFDETRIRQVLINLLSNAGRFTERGGVTVEAHRTERDVVCSVTDTGPGIKLKDRERIFEPFQQVDGSIQRRHGGSGLGLSISKQFVEMHDGKMWLESEVAAGTTFYFTLPLLNVPPDAGSGMLKWFHPYWQYDTRTRQSKAPAPKVLPRYIVVEEEETLRQSLRRHINNDKIELVSATTIDAGVRELHRSPAQAFIVNAAPSGEPPGGLTDLPYETPAIACWIPGTGEAAKRLGVMRYLVKPVTREKLLGALQSLGQDIENVLLVDDEPELLQLFTRILSAGGQHYRVLQATGGRRALGLLRERKPDVVLLDLMMPGTDGFQVLQEKGQDPEIRHIPVIVISSKDPMSEPIVSNALTVTKGGGLSVRDIIACIDAISRVLAPSSHDQA